MKQFKRNLRLGFIFLLSFFAIFVSVAGAQDAQNLSGTEVLARVKVTGNLNDLGLPIYADLSNDTGTDYVLVITSELQLNEAHVFYEILDTITERDDGKYYMIATMEKNNTRNAAKATVDVLHDDGFHIIARVSKEEAVQLTEIGFELVQLNETPMVFREAAQSFLVQQAIEESNDDVTDMIKSVKRSTVVEHMENLTGVHPAIIGGSNYTIKTRRTDSGDSIDKAKQYVSEFMVAQGLTVSYHDWTLGGYTNQNVIGEISASNAGTEDEEIVLIVAHLDSQPSGDFAPGADDNASGSVGVMMAAQALSQYNFQRTIRFVLVTGEEQGLLGSQKYAEKIKADDGDKVVAVYNMDMIAWDAMNEPKLRIYTRAKRDLGHEGDMVIANTFLDVVNTYDALEGIPLNTVLAPVITLKGGHWGGHWSDHASFWGVGYSAVCAIEDDHSDWNRTNYHTVDDTIHTLNFTYFTNFIRATVGTAAHLAIPE